jgi:hypothetical protein
MAQWHSGGGLVRAEERLIGSVSSGVSQLSYAYVTIHWTHVASRLVEKHCQFHGGARLRSVPLLTRTSTWPKLVYHRTVTALRSLLPHHRQPFSPFPQVPERESSVLSSLTEIERGQIAIYSRRCLGIRWLDLSHFEPSSNQSPTSATTCSSPHSAPR